LYNVQRLFFGKILERLRKLLETAKTNVFSVQQVLQQIYAIFVLENGYVVDLDLVTICCNIGLSPIHYDESSSSYVCSFFQESFVGDFFEFLFSSGFVPDAPHEFADSYFANKVKDLEKFSLELVQPIVIRAIAAQFILQMQSKTLQEVFRLWGMNTDVLPGELANFRVKITRAGTLPQLGYSGNEEYFPADGTIEDLFDCPLSFEYPAIFPHFRVLAVDDFQNPSRLCFVWFSIRTVNTPMNRGESVSGLHSLSIHHLIPRFPNARTKILQNLSAVVNLQAISHIRVFLSSSGFITVVQDSAKAFNDQYSGQPLVLLEPNNRSEEIRHRIYGKNLYELLVKSSPDDLFVLKAYRKPAYKLDLSGFIIPPPRELLKIQTRSGPIPIQPVLSLPETPPKEPKPNGRKSKRKQANPRHIPPKRLKISVE
jgi:hypothetical protein